MDRGKTWANRAILVASGLIGAVGVAAAASASHGESRNMASIATVCLAHGPALLALALLGRGRVLDVAAMLLAIGTIVFVGDLGLREWQAHGIFSGAAPLAGGAMVLGWLGVALGGVCKQYS